MVPIEKKLNKYSKLFCEMSVILWASKLKSEYKKFQNLNIYVKSNEKLWVNKIFVFKMVK